MIGDSNKFKDLCDFIDHMKKHEDILCIFQYGGRKFTDMSKGGDYDLTLVFHETVSENFSGVHLHIGGIPVDCMILSKEDFLKEEPADGFHLAHLYGELIYDKDGEGERLLRWIEEKWTPNKELSPFQRSFYRFIYRHGLDKLEHRLHEDELYSRYMINSLITCFLEFYGAIKGLKVGKPKEVFRYMKEDEHELYNIVQRLYSEIDLSSQYELLKKAAEYMAEDIGGLWRDDEVLFHLCPWGENHEDEQKEFIRKYF